MLATANSAREGKCTSQELRGPARPGLSQQKHEQASEPPPPREKGPPPSHSAHSARPRGGEEAGSTRSRRPTLLKTISKSMAFVL